MYSDISGYLTEKQTNSILVGAFFTTVLLASIFIPGSTILAFAFLGGMGGIFGQVISNVAHGEDPTKNAIGAFVGGVIAGAFIGTGIGIITGAVAVATTSTLLVGGSCIVGGSILSGGVNAFLNEIENEQFYDNDPELFSWGDIRRETALYSTANILSAPVGGQGMTKLAYYTVIDAAAYYVMEYIK